MTAFRRHRWNFALQHAVHLANDLNKPLLVFEAVRLRYPWSCERFHRFIVDGMLDNATGFSKSKATYISFVEQKHGDGQGIVAGLARRACAIVSDDFPCFFHPTMYQRIAADWPCSFDLVDSNGILPMRSADRTFTVAHSYRRYMQKEVPKHFDDFPLEEPLKQLKTTKLAKLPDELINHPAVIAAPSLAKLKLDELSIDHSVAPTQLHGGSTAAEKVLERFIAKRLNAYGEDRNEPSKHGSSGLSPYLHFGHISAHEIFDRIMQVEEWNPSKVGKPNGKMTGYWNLSDDAEAFMDQLMTWREIGFNMCSRESNYDRYESLPAWARKTLTDHARDKRAYVYSEDEFEKAATHDELWNAAQRQLVREGIIHNYLRMLWGKKILHWSESPQEALRIMIQLNNKYGLDGRNPNSYSGIFWVLGRYDRAWGPERPIFGKIRYMTSESTRSKYRVKEYLDRYSG
jgi:deoxyribodipyrimidine photo-lyase